MADHPIGRHPRWNMTDKNLELINEATRTTGPTRRNPLNGKYDEPCMKLATQSCFGRLKERQPIAA